MLLSFGQSRNQCDESHISGPCRTSQHMILKTIFFSTSCCPLDAKHKTLRCTTCQQDSTHVCYGLLLSHRLHCCHHSLLFQKPFCHVPCISFLLPMGLLHFFYLSFIDIPYAKMRPDILTLALYSCFPSHDGQ